MCETKTVLYLGTQPLKLLGPIPCISPQEPSRKQNSFDYKVKFTFPWSVRLCPRSSFLAPIVFPATNIFCFKRSVLICIVNYLFIQKYIFFVEDIQNIDKQMEKMKTLTSPITGNHLVNIFPVFFHMHIKIHLFLILLMELYFTHIL